MTETSFYIDKFFDEYNVRFISIEEGIDTLKRDSTTRFLMPIKNLFNSMHPQETSIKTIDALDAKAKNGEHTASKPPYGYVKSVQGKNKLQIDEESAEIVRTIFELAAEGKGYNKIARILTERKIPTPFTYFVQKNPNYYKNEEPFHMTHVWNFTTIQSILKNQVYLGKIVHGRRRTKSVSSKKTVKRPESEWIVADASHDPIVTKEQWDAAQAKLETRTRTGHSGKLHLFAGLVACKDCGTYMQFNNRKFKTGKLNGEFVCGKYKKLGKEYCSTHYITFDTLYNVVKQEIMSLEHFLKQNEKSFIERLQIENNRHTATSASKAKKEMESIQLRLKKIDDVLAQAYEDRVERILTVEAYQKLQNKFDLEAATLKERYVGLEKDAVKVDEIENNINTFAEVIKQVTKCQELNAKILNQLITKIYIGQAVINLITKQKEQEIEIQYKVNIVNELLQFEQCDIAG